jgi:hypothetical protein
LTWPSGFDTLEEIRTEVYMDEDRLNRLLMPVGRSGWAIASGYLGLLSLFVVPAPFAVLTGILGILDIRKHPERHGMGRCVFGIVMGTIVTVAFAASFLL